jgi:hypothetical protein
MDSFINDTAPQRLEDFRTKDHTLHGASSSSSQENYEGFI